MLCLEEGGCGYDKKRKGITITMWLLYIENLITDALFYYGSSHRFCDAIFFKLLSLLNFIGNRNQLPAILSACCTNLFSFKWQFWIYFFYNYYFLNVASIWWPWIIYPEKLVDRFKRYHGKLWKCLKFHQISFFFWVEIRKTWVTWRGKYFLLNNTVILWVTVLIFM